MRSQRPLRSQSICGANVPSGSPIPPFLIPSFSPFLPSSGDNRYGPVVAVSLDYRLNIFGFLALQDLSQEQVGREGGREGWREKLRSVRLYSRHFPPSPAPLSFNFRVGSRATTACKTSKKLCGGSRRTSSTSEEIRGGSR